MPETKRQKEDLTKYNFQKRKRKQNLSVPLEEDTISKLDKTAEKYNLSRAELMRFALEYAVKSEGFNDLLKQL
jgi:metal-responsive CopG/Arc/MetJ family transcriptional regulator